MSLHKNIKLLTWFNFFTDFRLYAPIAIVYFSKVSGSFALGMSVFSITMIATALFEIPTGILSDFVGRKKTLVLGAAAAVSYSILYALGGSFWMLAAGAVFEGLSRSFYSGNNEAFLHDTLAETHQEHAFDEYLGKISAMFQASLAVSALFGSIIATWSFPLIMWLSVIPQALCFVLSFLMQEPKVHGAESGNMYEHLQEAISYFFTNKKLRLLNIASVLGYGFGEAAYQFQAVFYASLLPLWAVGLVKTLSNIGAFFGFHYSGSIIRKQGAAFTLFVGEGISRLVSIIALVIPTPISPFLMSSTSILFGFTTVAENSLLQKEFTQKQRATMASLNSFVGSFFFGIVAFLLGYIADIISARDALLLFQFLLVPTLLVYWLIFKMRDT